MAMNGMIASPHYLASQAGLRVLRDGGNAVDAAVAANAVLTVVMPDNCSIGGDAFFQIWDPRTGTSVGLNGSGRAPSGLSIESVSAAGHEVMPERGPLTVTVPGTVDAWQQALDAYGTRELGPLLQDAIDYASEGFPVTPHLNAAITLAANMLGADPAARRQFLHEDKPVARGTILRQPALATTLRTIAREGAEAFYRGVVGERIVRSLNTWGSPISMDDLAEHTSTWVQPISTMYRGLKVQELPPNTQGVTALQMLNMASGWDPARWDVNSAEQIHHFVESKKLAFRDRDQYISDPEFVDIPVERLTSIDYAHELRSKIDSEKAAVEDSVSPGAGDTVYLCAFDSNGMAVSLIQSVFRGFGSGIVAEGTGILLQNRGASFTMDDSAANSLQPRKRSMHTLIPGLALKDDFPWLVFGCMGAHGQAQTHLQLVSKIVDYGFNPQEAIESPRWVAGPDAQDDPQHLLRVEPEIGEDVVSALSEKGHEVRVTVPFSSAMGHAQAIHVDRENGVLIGGADPRANGYALGW